MSSLTQRLRAFNPFTGTVLPAHEAAGDGYCPPEPSPDCVSIWPEDRDAVPEWRLKAEQRARDIGLDLPTYRTRAEFERAVAACTPLEVVAQLPETPPATLVLNGNRQFAKDKALADLLSLDDGAPSQDWLAKRWHRHKGTVSKWLTLWASQGLIVRFRDGTVKRACTSTARAA